MTHFDPAAIRAVAFDGYGTLFRFDGMRGDALFALWRLTGDHEAFWASVEGSYDRAAPWRALVEADGRVPLAAQLNGSVPDWLSSWDLWRRQYAIALEEHGLEGDIDLAAARLRQALAEAPAYPDALETTEALAQRGLLLGLLSNADEDFLQRAVSSARLRFSVIQSSESLRAYKPHRSVFDALCGRLACAPEEVLYVGDSATHDVLGAANAGLHTAWMRRDARAYPSDLTPPDIEITQLGDLLELLPPAITQCP